MISAWPLGPGPSREARATTQSLTRPRARRHRPKGKRSTVGGLTEARYDAVADFYISGFGSADDPASLALLELLGQAAGLRVLGVACGHGRITRELARRGD